MDPGDIDSPFTMDNQHYDSDRDTPSIYPEQMMLQTEPSITAFSPFSQVTQELPATGRSSDTTSTDGPAALTPQQLQASAFYQPPASTTTYPSPSASLAAANLVPLANHREPSQSTNSSGLIDWSGEMPRVMSRVLGIDFNSQTTSLPNINERPSGASQQQVPSTAAERLQAAALQQEENPTTLIRASATGMAKLPPLSPASSAPVPGYIPSPTKPTLLPMTGQPLTPRPSAIPAQLFFSNTAPSHEQLMAAAQAAALHALSNRTSFESDHIQPVTDANRQQSEALSSLGLSTPDRGSFENELQQQELVYGSTSIESSPRGPIFPAARYSMCLESPDRSSDRSSDGARPGYGARSRAPPHTDSLPLSDSMLSSNLQHHLALMTGSRHQQPPSSPSAINNMMQRVKVLVSSGGKFRQSASSSVEYIGGDVRLVTLIDGYSHSDLISTLSKASDKSSVSTSRSGGGTDAILASRYSQVLPGFCIVRYKLPSDHKVMVDVVDDQDVVNMFEEYHELRAAQGPVAPKLHLYVEWLQHHTHGIMSSNDSLGGGGFAGYIPGSGSSMASDDEASIRFGLSLHHASAQDLRLAAARTNHLEVISPEDVKILELLGTGSYGDMYRAEWKDTEVAIKCLNPVMVGLEYSSRSAWLDFLHETNRIGALRHPNLVEVYGVVLPSDPRISKDGPWPSSPDHPLSQGRRSLSLDTGAGSSHWATSLAEAAQKAAGPLGRVPAMVMEFVEARSLRTAVARNGDIIAGKLTRALYAYDTAKAIAYLHSKGIAHHALKSSNVLLGWRNRRPTAKVAGYSLSAAKASLAGVYTPGVTSNRSVLPWIAPEVIRNPSAVSHKADSYSFAMILYELWALKAPWAELTTSQHDQRFKDLFNTEKVMRPPLPLTMPEPGPGWRDLMERLWDEDPDKRPELNEVAEELRGIALKIKESQRAFVSTRKKNKSTTYTCDQIKEGAAEVAGSTTS